MPDIPPSEYITKTEAARLYRRSERSISRDITSAVKFGDNHVLQHIELRLEDGTRRAGPELTIEEIVELRDRGLNPTWMLQTTWLEKNYGRRDTPLENEIRSPGTFTTPDVVPDATESQPANIEHRVAVLAAQNDALRQANLDLRNQTERLEKELDRRAEERREENELQKQNNVLMQQVYNLLSRMQDTTGPISILPAARESQKPTEQPVPVESKMRGEREGSPAPQSPARRTKSPQKTSAVIARSVRTPKQPVPSKLKPTQSDEGVLQRWFPTFMGSSRRQKK
jgi:hypothetical protein